MKYSSVMSEPDLTSEPENSAASYSLHDRLGFRVSRLAAIMRASLDKELLQLGLTRLEWCVLASIALEGITAPSEIAENIGITRPTASRTFKQMRAKGWLLQNLTDGDGRARAITLTDAGQDLLARARVLVDAHQARFLGKLDRQAAAHFLSSLDTLLEGVHDRFDDP